MLRFESNLLSILDSIPRIQLVLIEPLFRPECLPLALGSDFVSLCLEKCFVDKILDRVPYYRQIQQSQFEQELDPLLLESLRLLLHNEALIQFVRLFKTRVNVTVFSDLEDYIQAVEQGYSSKSHVCWSLDTSARLIPRLARNASRFLESGSRALCFPHSRDNPRLIEITSQCKLYHVNSDVFDCLRLNETCTSHNSG
jgi:hypothetical protein